MVDIRAPVERPVRLYLGFAASHARGHQASDLGYRARLGPNERKWLAVATVVGSVRLTIVIDSLRAVLHHHEGAERATLLLDRLHFCDLGQ
jgi:hypothetical protein